MEEKNLMPLASVKPNIEMTIVNIAGGYGIRRKLADMGLVPGTKVKVVSRNMLGPVILAVRNYRLAIGRGVASKIMVD
ncbi:MAG: ferrous iron transport protein A [Actinomycetia bacterium]|nr:ferrous iron transport protein A [Actinomycetes bacterium]